MHRGGMREEVDKADLEDFYDGAEVYLAVRYSPGYGNSRPAKSIQPAGSLLPSAAAPFIFTPASYGDRTSEPVVSIQLADDDDEEPKKQAVSGKPKRSIYQRVWGAGPSPILQRQFQRYSLRRKTNGNVGHRSTVADSPGGRDTPLAASRTQGMPPADTKLRQSPVIVAQQCSETTFHQPTRNNSSHGSAMSSNQEPKSVGLNNQVNSSPPESAVRRTPELRVRSSTNAAARTPDAHATHSPASTAIRETEAPVVTQSTPPMARRTQAGGTRKSPAPATGFRTPETRLPRVAYLTPGAKRATPGSALAYRTTASSPGPFPVTPPSAIQPSPARGSGRKSIQYHPRGLDVLRYATAASASASGPWPGISPSRSDIVATPNPGMARTLDGLLLAEDIIAALVACAVDLAENGTKPSTQNSSGTARPSRAKLDVVTEGDRADVMSEGEGGTYPGCVHCRCNIM